QVKRKITLDGITFRYILVTWQESHCRVTSASGANILGFHGRMPQKNPRSAQNAKALTGTLREDQRVRSPRDANSCSGSGTSELLTFPAINIYSLESKKLGWRARIELDSASLPKVLASPNAPATTHGRSRYNESGQAKRGLLLRPLDVNL